MPRAPPSYNCSVASLPVCVLRDLLDCGILAPCQQAVSYGRLSLVLGAKPAIIFDGRAINDRFASEGLYPASPMTPNYATILQRMNAAAQGSRLYMMSTDISKCYHSIRLPTSWCSTFGVRYGNQSFAFQTLPFGFSGAPYICQQITTNILQQTLASLPSDWIVDGVVYLDDFLVWGQVSEQVNVCTARLRLRLRRAGFLTLPDKNMQSPATSVKWLGKIWCMTQGTPSIAIAVPDPKSIQGVYDIIRILDEKPQITKHQLQRVLGIVCWVFLPGILLPFAAHLFNVLYKATKRPQSAVLSIPPTALDLLHQGLSMVLDASVLQPQLIQRALPQLSHYLPGAVALSNHNIFFVDYAAAFNLAALVHITPEGDVFVRQWRISGSVQQQYGELASLCAAIYIATTKSTSGPSLVFSDNIGAIFTMLSFTGPNIKGRAYWLRRLAKALWYLILAQDNVRPVELGHCPGSLIPADWYTRSDYVFFTETWVASVPVV